MKKVNEINPSAKLIKEMTILLAEIGEKKRIFSRTMKTIIGQITVRIQVRAAFNGMINLIFPPVLKSE